MDLFKIKNVQQLENFINEDGDIFEVDDDDETPLFKKHVQKNPELFRAFVEAGIDINALNNDCETVLMKASDTETIKLILECKGDPNINLNGDNDPPIFFHMKSYDNLSLLIEYGADLNVLDQDEEHILWDNDLSLDMARFLISKGANIKFENEYKENILFYTESRALMDLAIKAGVNPNGMNHDGKVPLFYTVDIKTIEFLVKNGADLNKKDEYGYSILSYYPLSTLEEAKIFIKNGLDINYSPKGDFPDAYKIPNKKEQLEIIKYFEEQGLDLTKQNSNGLNITSCDNIGYELLKYLLEEKNIQLSCTKNFDVFSNNENNEKLLEITELLISQGWDMNRKFFNDLPVGLSVVGVNKSMSTLLPNDNVSVAAKVLNYLIDSGLDIHAKNWKGENALSYCRNLDCANVLIKNGIELIVSGDMSIEVQKEVEALIKIRDEKQELDSLLINKNNTLKTRL